MHEITIVELRNNLRKHLEGVYFRGQPLAVHRYGEQQVVLVRRDQFERLERDYQAVLRELAALQQRLDAGA